MWWLRPAAAWWRGVSVGVRSRRSGWLHAGRAPPPPPRAPEASGTYPNATYSSTYTEALVSSGGGGGGGGGSIRSVILASYSDLVWSVVRCGHTDTHDRWMREFFLRAKLSCVVIFITVDSPGQLAQKARTRAPSIIFLLFIVYSCRLRTKVAVAPAFTRSHHTLSRSCSIHCRWWLT